MGVIHKLKPEVLSFIIENKQNNPALSCRHLTSLVLEQLHIKVSKSSVNAVFKEKNLSMPIGRRPKLKKRKFNMPVLPVIEDVEAARLDNLPPEVHEQENDELAKEKAAVESARIKALEEDRLREIERLAQEAEENKRKQEAARKLEEEKAAELARVKALEEEKLREAERLAREAEEKIKRDEEIRKLAEEKIAQELARIKSLEEARLRDLERLAQEAEEKRKRDEEIRKLAEEKIAQELARVKALEEEKLREIEKLAQEAEEKRRKLEEEKAAAELARIKALEEDRLREIERLAKEAEEEKRKQEAARKLEEEKAAELARVKALEEEKLREAERLAREAEENRRKQELEKKIEEEKAVQEAELKAERERWVRLAEEEQRARQQASKPQISSEEAASVNPEPVVVGILPEDRVCSGAIMLKALDGLLGASKEINAVISRAIGSNPEDSLSLTEALLFKSLFIKDKFSTVGDLIGVQHPPEKIANYYAQIKQVTGIGLDIAKTISDVFTEAKGVKVNFSDKSVVYLDGQLHSSWPATRFPHVFSSTIYDLKNSLDKCFFQGQPLVLFSPPGYDILPKDFFNLLVSFSSKDNYPESLTLFGNQAEDLDNIPLGQENKCSVIFGLWPWQFTSSRKVKKIGEFSSKYIRGLDRDLYLGEIEIDLFRASLNQTITLRGCAVKVDPKEKIRLVILGNKEPAMDLETLADTYLSHWPNFEEAFQDFSRKIELFTYAGNEQKFFSKEGFGMDTAGLTMEVPEIFANYVKMLDAYLRWHFLTPDYADKDLSFTSECFYKIPVKLTPSQNRLRTKTLVSQDYQFLKDLEYLNCRLNERQIKTADGKVFWFESAFK
ncbi:MAG: hypothetical protein PHS66_06710 [Candidatus Omnitrophica bacterium]|nr:hypothetical protein [Candidatus Omnitrophota bacterium]